jgi:antitoxin VapB
MALSIKSEEADRLAREPAAETGESLTTAVTLALREPLARFRRRSNLVRDLELGEIFERTARTPRRDPRSDDELLGYNAVGTFG